MKVLIKLIFFLLLFIFLLIGSFLFGLHWHGTIAQKINPDKLMCWGHNNLWETFQVDCYYPLNKKQTKFKFSKEIKCSLITNSQLFNDNSKYQPGKQLKYNGVSLIKTDYRNFVLKFDYPNNEVIKSFDPGEPLKEPFVIIQNDNNVINAIRKTKIDDFFGYEYQYLTLSKKTGKGIISWLNTENFNSDEDSIASEFFQCQ